MGRIKMLYLGAFFCLVASNVQALVFEIPLFPCVEVVIATDLGSNGLRIGVPFGGGMVKHAVTVGGLYKDVTGAAEFCSKAVITTCMEGTITKKNDWNKKVAVFAAQSLKQEVLEKKLKEFFVLKAQFKTLSIEKKRRYIILKHEIRAILAK